MLNQLLVNAIVYLLAGGGCLVIGALLLNKPPFDQPPGLAVRLYTYFTTNVAETRRNHRFPELEMPCYRLAPRTLFTRVEHAIELLAWQLVDSDPERLRLHAVAETALWKFKDDIEIRLVAADYGTELHVRARSRVGRGDFGANTRHILNLIQMLRRQA